MKDVAKARMRETAAMIEKHLAETPDASLSPGQPSAREAELLAIAASHREFLKFVQWHLNVPLWYSTEQTGPETFAQGHFDRLMLRMVMKPSAEGEKTLEYGETINFTYEDLIPSDRLWRGGSENTPSS